MSVAPGGPVPGPPSASVGSRFQCPGFPEGCSSWSRCHRRPARADLATVAVEPDADRLGPPQRQILQVGFLTAGLNVPHHPHAADAHDLARGGDAIHAGHVNAHQDHIGMMQGDKSHSFLAVGRLGDNRVRVIFAKQPSDISRCVTESSTMRRRIMGFPIFDWRRCGFSRNWRVGGRQPPDHRRVLDFSWSHRELSPPKLRSTGERQTRLAIWE